MLTGALFFVFNVFMTLAGKSAPAPDAAPQSTAVKEATA